MFAAPDLDKLPTVQDFANAVTLPNTARVSLKDARFVFDSNEGDLSVILNDKSYRLSGNACKGLKQFTDISRSELWKYSQDQNLVNQIIQHLIRNSNDLPVELTTFNDDIVSIENPMTHHDHRMVIDTLAEVVTGTDTRVLSFGFNPLNGRMDIKIVTEANMSPCNRAGDLSHAGVCIESNGQFSVSPFVYRLVCSNGLRMPQKVSSSRFADSTYDPKIITKEYVAEAFNRQVEILQKFISLDTVKVDNPAEYLNRMLRTNGVPSRTRTRITDSIAWDTTQELTAYDVVNTVTGLHNEEDENFTRRIELLGGQMTEMTHTNCACEVCGSRVHN